METGHRMYWLFIATAAAAALGCIAVAGAQGPPSVEKPLVAIPYFVHGVEPVKALIDGCIKNRPEIATSLRAGVSLTASLGRFCDTDVLNRDSHRFFCVEWLLPGCHPDGKIVQAIMPVCCRIGA